MPRRNALITGITGQDGSYLTEYLLHRGYNVFGVIRRSTATGTNLDLIKQPRGPCRLELLYGDMLDAESLRTAIRTANPDEIYNLAAQSHVKVSFDMPAYTADVTGTGVLHLLEAVRDVAPFVRFYQASTSEMFGAVTTSPQDEQTPFNPQSPYANAKLLAYHAVRNYREGYGLFACNGIMFNHESPRRGDHFVSQKIVKAAVNILYGRQRQLHLGNLNAMRDWGYAADYVEAMHMISTADTPDDYVVATGISHTVREFCDRVFHAVGLPLRWQGEGLHEVGSHGLCKDLVVVDPAFFRPTEVATLQGNPAKLQAALGWEAPHDFDDLVKIMVADALRKLK